MKNLAKKLSNNNRRKKFDLFLQHFSPSQDVVVLDVGASEQEYQEGANILEKRYPYPRNITALGVESYNEFKKRYPEVKAINYDGQGFPFAANAFDICWSNAVLEHVGNKERQVFFIREIKRTSKKAFVTTPNRFFPAELHTKIFLMHFLPKKMFDRFLTMIGKKWATGDYMHLLSFRQLKQILTEAGITDYKIIKNRFLGFVVEFIVIF